MGSHVRPTQGHVETPRAFDNSVLTGLQPQSDTPADGTKLHGMGGSGVRIPQLHRVLPRGRCGTRRARTLCGGISRRWWTRRTGGGGRGGLAAARVHRAVSAGGARSEEARALTFYHADLETGTVLVWRSVRAHGDTKTVWSRRTLRLPEMAVEALRVQPRRDAACSWPKWTPATFGPAALRVTSAAGRLTRWPES